MTDSRRDTLSLWRKVYEDVPKIDPGPLYLGTDLGAVHPILLWGDSHIIYFLVGDGSAAVDAAAWNLSGL